MTASMHHLRSTASPILGGTIEMESSGTFGQVTTLVHTLASVVKKTNALHLVSSVIATLVLQQRLSIPVNI